MYTTEEPAKAVMPSDESIMPVKLNNVAGAAWQTNGERAFWPCGKVIDKLEPAFYSVKWDGTVGRAILVREDLYIDELVRPSSVKLDELLAGLETFWDSANMFKKLGLVHKRGILLYGPAGTGKSSLCLIIAADVIKRGGIVIKFQLGNGIAVGDMISMLHDIRQRQVNTPMVVLIEDIDAYVEQHDVESAILNLMDGSDSIEKTVFVATTNFASELGDRIVNRPSRFDWRVYIGPADIEDRKQLLTALFKRAGVESPIDQWAEDSNGFTMADLKELFILVHVFGFSYDLALERVRELAEKLKEDEMKRAPSAGFTGSRPDYNRKQKTKKDKFVVA